MATAGKALQNCHARFPCWATAATALTRLKGRIAGGRGVFLHDYGRCCHSHEANVRRLWYNGVSTAHSVQRQPYSPHRGISNEHGRKGTAKLPCTIPMLGHCCHSTDTAETANCRRPRSLPSYRAMAVAAAANVRRLWYNGMSTVHPLPPMPLSPSLGFQFHCDRPYVLEVKLMPPGNCAYCDILAHIQPLPHYSTSFKKTLHSFFTSS